MPAASERAFTPCHLTSAGFANEKTGTSITAAIHIFCAIVGAGVLALPRILAWLGWIAGPICIIVFYIISLISSRMLAMVYCVNGTEHARYHHAVRHILGRTASWGVSAAQLTNLFLIDIAYTITGVIAMKAIATQACSINGITDCWNTTWKLTLIFSAVQVVLSQIPNLEAAWWVSTIGTITSLFYCTVALVLGLVYSGAHLGSVGGIQANNVNKAFGVLNALGGIAFSYSFSLILLEIQDTLKQPPATTRTMKRAVNVAITGSFCYYFTVAVAGYVSLGNEVPSMVLTGFPEAPVGLLIAANVAILLHMVTAYQVYGQPMFDTIESWFKFFYLKAKGVKPTGAITDVEQKQTVTVAPTAAPYPAPPAPAAVATGTAHVGAADVAGVPGSTLAAPGATMPDTGEQAVRDRLVRNTAPHPSLRPEGYVPPARVSATSPTGAHLERRSAIAATLHRLSQQAGMYHVDTGATNEAVPSNDDYFFLPFWQRFLLRTGYVCITCIIAIIIPFFSDMVGLIGALTFFPLAIYYPFRMYNKVYRPRGAVLAFMWIVGVLMLLVCTGATIAAVRGIINSWTTYQLFGI